MGAGPRYYCHAPQPAGAICERGDQCEGGLICLNQRCTAESDRDRDGVPDARDNCPDVSNANQADANRNGRGDSCEPREDTFVNVRSCSDSDINQASGNSNDYGLRGTATGRYLDGHEFRLTDYCLDSHTLVEYLCESGMLGYLYANCSAGNQNCVDGICR